MQMMLIPNTRVMICEEYHFGKEDGEEYTGWRVLNYRDIDGHGIIGGTNFVRLDKEGNELPRDKRMTKQEFERLVKEQWNAGEVKWNDTNATG